MRKKTLMELFTTMLDEKAQINEVIKSIIQIEKTISSWSTEFICKIIEEDCPFYDSDEVNLGLHVYFKDFLVDELDNRDPLAFQSWIFCDSEEDFKYPSKFFLSN